MKIFEFLIAFQRRRRLWLTIGTVGMWVLTVGTYWTYLCLTGGSAHPAVPIEYIMATACLSVMTVFVGVFCRSEWQGAMVGSGFALLLGMMARRWFYLPSGSEMTTKIVGLCGLCPLLAGFWGAWMGRWFASEAGRRERPLALVIALVALPAIFHNSSDSPAPVDTFTVRPATQAVAQPAPQPVTQPRPRHFDYLGILPLPDPARFEPSRTNISYLSPDGDVAAGSVRDKDARDHAVIWQTGRGVTDLGDKFSPGADSCITGVSADGTAVAGSYLSDHGMRPFFCRETADLAWTQIHFSQKDDSRNISPANFSIVSSDGAYALGEADSETVLWSDKGIKNLSLDIDKQVFQLGPSARWFVGADSATAFVWTQKEGMVYIGAHKGGNAIGQGSVAYCASDDARFVAGMIGNRLFRWSRQGTEKLGYLPLHRTANVFFGYEPSLKAISRTSPASKAAFDGSFFRITNDGETIAGINAGKPFVWRANRGIVKLTMLMRTSGADANIIAMPIKAIALSTDGDFLTGISENEKGTLIRWRLHLKQ